MKKYKKCRPLSWDLHLSKAKDAEMSPVTRHPKRQDLNTSFGKEGLI